MTTTNLPLGPRRNRRMLTGTLALVLLSPVGAAHASTSAPATTTDPVPSLCTLCTSVTVTGTVSAYVKATATTDGYLTIGGVKHVIKAGVTLPAVVTVGSSVQLTLTLDGAGKITACAVASVKVTVTGTVSAYLPATSLTTGSLILDGQTYVVATGTVISGVRVGLHLTLELSLNSAGQVTSCRTV